MQNLSATDFFKPTHFNKDTKNQIWMSIIADSHDCICNCNSPFGHLLASIFPPGHKDRDFTINQIIKRDYLQQCHSGGDADESHGSPAAGDHTEREDHSKIKEEEQDIIKDEELQELIAAGEDAGTR